MSTTLKKDKIFILSYCLPSGGEKNIKSAAGGAMPLIAGYIIKQNPASMCPPEVFNDLVGLRVPIWTLERGVGIGIIEIHRDVALDIEEFFEFMVTSRFPVMRARPVAEYEWDDMRSMLANNTSAFNYRKYISKSDGLEKISPHSFGRAIDTNPFFNPDMQDGITDLKGAVYDPSRPGTLTAVKAVTLFLKRRGWIWGGDWESHQDYQHFEKPE
jgi:hypothetical protein